MSSVIPLPDSCNEEDWIVTITQRVDDVSVSVSVNDGESLICYSFLISIFDL